MAQFKELTGKSLGARVFVSIGVIVLLFAVVLAVWDIVSTRKNRLADLETQAKLTANLMWLAVETQLRLGSDHETTGQFKLLGEKYPASSMSIAGSDGVITYSSSKGEIKNGAAGILHPQIAEAYRDSLESKAPEPFIHTQNGRRKFMVFTPIDNEPACYHCHGWSRPVLGAAAVAVDVEDQLSSLTYSNIASALVAVLSGLLLSCLLFLAVRAKALARIYALRESSEQLIAGYAGLKTAQFDKAVRVDKTAPNILAAPDVLADSDVLAGSDIPTTPATMTDPDALPIPSGPVNLSRTPGPSGTAVTAAPDISTNNSSMADKPHMPDMAGKAEIEDELAIIARNVDAAVAISDGLLLPLAALEAISAPLLICGRGGEIIHCNAALTKLLGYPDAAEKAAALHGQPLQNLLGAQATAALLPFATPGTGQKAHAAQSWMKNGAIAGNNDICMELEIPALSGNVTACIHAALFWTGEAPAQSNSTVRRLSDLPENHRLDTACGIIAVFSDLTTLKQECRSLRQNSAMQADKALRSIAQSVQDFQNAGRSATDIAQSSSMLTGQLGHARTQTESVIAALQAEIAAASDLNTRLQALFAKTATLSASSSSLQADIRESAAQLGSIADSITDIGEAALQVKEYFEGVEAQRANLAQAMQSIQDMADRFNYIALNSAIEASTPNLSARHLRNLAEQLRTLAEEAIKNTADARQQLNAFAEAAKTGLPLAELTLRIASGGLEQTRDTEQSLQACADNASFLAEENTNLIEQAGFAQQAGGKAMQEADAALALSG
ncbi:hypothetical protein LJC48_04625, partial [Desulfovibrio sp. OttesenSCG-928-C06]|nr:hypothetical protein [Desulfovibrio sp. OttesenSCG-928-C06]